MKYFEFKILVLFAVIVTASFFKSPSKNENADYIEDEMKQTKEQLVDLEEQNPE